MNMNMNQKKKWEKENKLHLYTSKHIDFSFVLQLHIFDKTFSMFFCRFMREAKCIMLTGGVQATYTQHADCPNSQWFAFGVLSEEAQEACSKICKYYHKHYTRKCSRKDSNFDLISTPCSKWPPHIESKGGKVPTKKSRTTKRGRRFATEIWSLI